MPILDSAFTVSYVNPHPQNQYTQKVDFAQLKSEMQLMEKNDLAMMKAENDRLATDLERLKQRLREDITRTQAGVRLDLNLEKGNLHNEWESFLIYSMTVGRSNTRRDICTGVENQRGGYKDRKGDS